MRHAFVISVDVVYSAVRKVVGTKKKMLCPSIRLQRNSRGGKFFRIIL